MAERFDEVRMRCPLPVKKAMHEALLFHALRRDVAPGSQVPCASAAAGVGHGGERLSEVRGRGILRSLLVWSSSFTIA